MSLVQVFITISVAWLFDVYSTEWQNEGETEKDLDLLSYSLYPLTATQLEWSM